MTSVFRDVRMGRDSHIEPEVGEGLRATWAGPINTEMYGKGLRDLCTNTQNNLNRLSYQMEKIDPCLEYGVKHWHPSNRPNSAGPRVEGIKSQARWENLDVMFTDYNVTKKLSFTVDEGTGSYVDPPVPVNRFCYLCSTMEEHKKHMLHHKPAKRPSSAKPRVMYIAPKPKVKKKQIEEEEILVKERLYKVEVFTSDLPNAGTSANVFITIQGSLELLPRTQLMKKRGCANFCFVRASKEVFHIMGPFLGNLHTLTIEHDGLKKFHGWHLDRIEVTDVKALKTWVFSCGEWLSMFEKPHYTNILDLKAEEKNMPLAEYNIEVYTGKKKMAGTDANIYLALSGEHGSGKKIHLVDNSKDKKLFERNSVDKFKVRMHSLGNLQKIRIEHDGKGLGAGWFLDRIIIKDSTRPKDTFYFLYNGWIAKDEGEGKLWRDIRAKKVLPKEVHEGEKTRYNIMVKTSDIRYAGTDANVFIQIAGTNGGITPKMKLDDAKNNFERNMVDNFEIDAVNVGVIDHIVIGHDNSGPGAGWHLEKVTIRRYVPKSEVKERMKKVKKRLKKEKKAKSEKERFETTVSDSTDDEDDYNRKSRKEKSKKKKYRDKTGLDSEGSDTDKKVRKDKTNSKYKSRSSKKYGSDSDDSDSKQSSPRRKEKKDKKKKSDKDSKSKKTRDLFSVSSSSSSSSESSDSESEKSKGSRSRKDSKTKRPGSALRRQSESTRGRKSPEQDQSPSRRSSSASSIRRPSSALSQSFSERRTSTSASSLRKRNDEENKNKKGKKKWEEDGNLSEARVPLYEEYLFVCNRWFAADEDDGLFQRELQVTEKTVYYKD